MKTFTAQQFNYDFFRKIERFMLCITLKVFSYRNDHDLTVLNLSKTRFVLGLY
jgi:hypothetical protein